MKSISKSAILLGALFVLFTSTSSYSAEASASFYGLIDVYVASSKAPSSSDRALDVSSSGMTTSFIGVNTKIDLGNGLNGVITLESFLRPDTGEAGRYAGDQFFARDAFVGLEGGFGKVYLGRNTTPYFISVILTNPFGGSFGFGPSIEHSFLGGLQGDSGWGNSVLYGSPKFGGLDFTLLYSAGEVAGATGTNRMGGNVFYSVGKFTGTLAYQSVDLVLEDPTTYTTGDTQTAGLLGASYDLGVAKLFAQYQKMKTTAATAGDTDWKTYQIGASVPAGKGSIQVSYAHTDITSGTDSDRKTYAVGYDYTINKQVDLYTVFNRDDPSTASSAGDTLAFGGRFQF